MLPADGLTGESIGSLCSLFLYDMIGSFPKNDVSISSQANEKRKHYRYYNFSYCSTGVIIHGQSPCANNLEKCVKTNDAHIYISSILSPDILTSLLRYR